MTGATEGLISTGVNPSRTVLCCTRIPLKAYYVLPWHFVSQSWNCMSKTGLKISWTFLCEDMNISQNIMHKMLMFHKVSLKMTWVMTGIRTLRTFLGDARTSLQAWCIEFDDFREQSLATRQHTSPRSPQSHNYYSCLEALKHIITSQTSNILPQSSISHSVSHQTHISTVLKHVFPQSL